MKTGRPRKYHPNSKDPRDVAKFKHATRKRVAYAVKTGRIIKPDNCVACGCIGPVEAHHFDYLRPFKILWLCRACHITIHPEKKGDLVGALKSVRCSKGHRLTPETTYQTKRGRECKRCSIARSKAWRIAKEIESKGDSHGR